MQYFLLKMLHMPLRLPEIISSFTCTWDNVKK